MADQIHVLYRMFNRDGVLLYVGITNDPKERFKAHGGEKSWWSEVANVTVEHLPSRQHLQAAESNAITNERPLYNIVRPVGAYLAEPPVAKCPTCRSPEPNLIPLDEYELLTEEGQLIPFCDDPFHFPGDEQAADKVRKYRDLYRKAGLLRLSAIAQERLERRRAAMEALGKTLDIDNLFGLKESPSTSAAKQSVTRSAVDAPGLATANRPTGSKFQAGADCSGQPATRVTP